MQDRPIWVVVERYDERPPVTDVKSFVKWLIDYSVVHEVYDGSMAERFASEHAVKLALESGNGVSTFVAEERQ